MCDQQGPTLANQQQVPQIPAEDFIQAVKEAASRGNLDLAEELSKAENRFCNTFIGINDEDAIDLNSIDYPYKLVINNTTFKGHFNVSGAHFKKSLDLSCCTFEQNVNFLGAQIDGRLTLAGARIFCRKLSEDKANFRLIHINGDLVAYATSEHRTSFSTDVNFSSAKVLGQATFSGAEIKGKLDLQGAEIKGNLFFSPKEKWRTEIDGQVWLPAAKIKGQVDLGGASIGAREVRGNYEDDKKVRIALALEAAEIEDGLLCSPNPKVLSNIYRTEIFGCAWLPGARITGKVDLSGARIEGDLVLREAKIEGKLDLMREIFDSKCYRTEITGKADLTRVQVSDGAFLRGAKIGRDLDKEKKSEGALILKEAKVQGGLKLNSSTRDFDTTTEIFGTTQLSGAKISGGADFSGAIIQGSLILKGVEIAGDLDCQLRKDYPTRICGNVELIEAKVAGCVDLSGASIGLDLNLEGAEIERNLDLTRNKWDNERDLSCELKSFNSPKLVNRNVNSGEAKEASKVNFRDTRIGKNLILKGTKIKGDFTCRLDRIQGLADFLMCSARSMELLVQYSEDLEFPQKLIPRLFQRFEKIYSSYRNFIFVKDPQSHISLLFLSLKDSNDDDEPKLNLALAEVVELKIPKHLPSKYWKEINLEGFKFQKLTWHKKDEGKGVENNNYSKEDEVRKNNSNGNRDKDQKTKKNSYVELLEAAKPFPKDTYRFMEKYLRNRDAEVDANRVFLAMKRRDRWEPVSEEVKISLWYRVWKYVRNFLEWVLLQVPTEYGTNYSKVTIYLLLVWFISGVLFWSSPESVEPHILATVNDAKTTPTVKQVVNASHSKPDHLSWTIAMWESTQIVLPIVSIPVAEKWEPSSESIINALEERYGWIKSVIDAFEEKFEWNRDWNKYISYENYASGISLISWLIVPSILAGIPGINRGERKQE